MLATEYAKYYGIEAQGEGESDLTFRERVSGVLRGMGKVIEAHEVFRDERYEDSDAVMGGIIGAVAQAFQGRDYGADGMRQVGDDIAAGEVVRGPEPENPWAVLLTTMLR